MNQYTKNTRMNPESDNDELTIDLIEVIGALLKKAHIIILTGIIVALLAFIGTKLFITPMYTAETKVYVLSKSDGSTGISATDLQAGSYLIKDYTELVKSRTVMEQVIAVLNLDMKPEQLMGMVSVEAATDSRILTIKVESDDPKQAKEIADAVREAVSVQITEIMNADAVNIVEKADLPSEPSSPNTMKNTMMGGILGIILAMGVVVLIFIMDDTIKTPDDVERYLGLNTLTSIPIAAGAKKNKKAKGLSVRQFAKTMNR